MPADHDVECAKCAPEGCLGTSVHTVLNHIRTSISPRALASLLGCPATEIPRLDGHALLGVLNKLTYPELVDLSRATGLAPDVLMRRSHHDTDSTGTTRRAQLIAMVLHNHPTGCQPENLARHLDWPLTTVYDTVQDILQHQPEGQRLRITGDGHLVLRPDDTCHPAIATATHPPTDPSFRLTPDLATSLWLLCHHSHTAAIPDDDITSLLTAGLITFDGQQFRPTIHVTHSLQFY